MVLFKLDNLSSYEQISIASPHICLSNNSRLIKIGNIGIIFLGLHIKTTPITDEFVVIGKLKYSNHDHIEYLRGNLNIMIINGEIKIRCSDNTGTFGWVGILSIPILFK